jgi:hypothetical protein
MNRRANSRNVPILRHHRQALTPDELFLTGPVQSADQQIAFSEAMGAVPRPTGGFRGCGYIGFNEGIQCNKQFGTIADYHPNNESFYSNWVANVEYPYSPSAPMYPVIETPGGIEQVFLGGGVGNTPCSQACTCLGNPSCECADVGDLKCGWAAVSHDCIGAVPGGKYPSLRACEAAQEIGYFGK